MSDVFAECVVLTTLDLSQKAKRAEEEKKRIQNSEAKLCTIARLSCLGTHGQSSNRFYILISLRFQKCAKVEGRLAGVATLFTRSTPD